jgi:hypothetical protein
MPVWFWIVVGVSLIGEVVAVWLVLKSVRAAQGALADLDFGALRELSEQIDQCVDEHMSAAYDGEPNHLADALRTLLPKVREVVHGTGITLDERGIRLLVTNAVAGHKLARRTEVLRALDDVAAPDQATAA